MSIATEITRMQTAKADIKTAIEAKGVTVPTAASIAVYDDYIGQITTGGGSTWNRPSDWATIDDCGTNEIFLIVSDCGTGLAFATTIASSGTYSIDWGDGTIETSRASGVTYQHQYTIGSGTPCSLGYTTFKVRVFNATNTVTGWGIRRHTFTSREQECPILEANIGATGLTTHANMFYYVYAAKYVYCRNLLAVRIASLENSTSCINMFYNCYALQSVTLPSSWGNVTDCYGMFYNCYTLQSVTLPSSWGNVTNCLNMFYNCYTLQSVTIPTSWGNVTNCGNILSGCYALQSVTLPSSWGNVTNCHGMFGACYSLQVINNSQYLGSLTTACNFSYFMQNAEAFNGEISIASLISKFDCYGASGYKNKVTSIRLTNASSTFGGSSPQINVNYCNLSAAALNQLFTDLPTLTGKTISITGCTGAATCDKTIATAKGWTVVG